MKKIIPILLLLSSYKVNSQIVIGMGAGYGTYKTAIFNLNVGVKFDEYSTFYYNQSIAVSTKQHAPELLGIRYGYNIGSWQPNLGLDYHLLSSDYYLKDKPQEGFKIAYGITKYFLDLPVKIDIGMSGKYAVFIVGFYKVL